MKRDPTHEELYARIRELEDQNNQQRATLKRVRTLLDSTEESTILGAITDGIVLMCNKKAASRLGMTVDELVGLSIFDYLPADLAEARTQQGDVVTRTKKPVYFQDVRGERVFENSIVPVLDDEGEVESLAIYAKDITNRVGLEKRLKEEEESFRALTEQSPNMIFINSEGQVVYVNPRCSELMGYEPNEFYAPEFDFRSLITEDSLAIVQANFAKHLQGEDVEPYECGLLTKDGKRLDVVLSTKLIKFRGRRSILGIMSDITERKRMEEALKLSHDSLEEVVRKRTATLIEVNKSLVKEIKGRKFVQAERDTYLKKVSSLVSRLSLSEENERRRIATEVHDHIGQNIALAKIKMSQMKKHPLSHDLSKMVDEALLHIDTAIQDTRSLVSEISSPVLYELGLVPALRWLAKKCSDQIDVEVKAKEDESFKLLNNNLKMYLFRAVQELLANVIKHAEATACTVSIISEGGNIQIDVEDNGYGFEMQHPEKGAAEKGFGLFSIRERVEPFGGKLRINSVQGQGTRVTISVPEDALSDQA